MTLAKVKEQDGMMLVKVKEQDNHQKNNSRINSLGSQVIKRQRGYSRSRRRMKHKILNQILSSITDGFACIGMSFG